MKKIILIALFAFMGVATFAKGPVSASIKAKSTNSISKKKNSKRIKQKPFTWMVCFSCGCVELGGDTRPPYSLMLQYQTLMCGLFEDCGCGD